MGRAHKAAGARDHRPGHSKLQWAVNGPPWPSPPRLLTCSSNALLPPVRRCLPELLPWRWTRGSEPPALIASSNAMANPGSGKEDGSSGGSGFSLGSIQADAGGEARARAGPWVGCPRPAAAARAHRCRGIAAVQPLAQARRLSGM